MKIYQVWPNNNSKGEPNKLQLKLMQKLGDNARHFILQFPQNSPNSVAIVGEPGDRLQMGVSYEVGTITNFLTSIITQSSMPIAHLTMLGKKFRDW